MLSTISKKENPSIKIYLLVFIGSSWLRPVNNEGLTTISLKRKSTKYPQRPS
jgi:hypothetical protein